MKLIIDGDFIAKKMKIWEIFEKYMLYTSKESLEHVEFRFRMKRYDFFGKNPQILNYFPILILILVLKRKIYFF